MLRVRKGCVRGVLGVCKGCARGERVVREVKGWFDRGVRGV